MTIIISPKLILKILTIVVLILVLASLATKMIGYFTPFELKLVDLDEKGNLPTWFKSVALLLGSGLFALISITSTNVGKSGPFGWHWRGLALIFLYLSIDDLATIHQKVDTFLRSWFQPNGFLVFAWVIPALVFLLVFGLTYLRFLLSLPRRTSSLLVLAGAVSTIGAIGFEIVGGWVIDYFGLDFAHPNHPAYLAAVTMEESMEMIGLVILIYALASHLKYFASEITMRFADT